MNHLDLFSGIGGFALSAKWCGIETVQFVEIDPFCQKVLAKNFPDVPIHDDIKTFNYLEKVDLLTGGFPCQPFSIAGKKKGKNDDRYLWPEMLRVIRDCRPTWILAENVAGIISTTIDNITMDLARENYEIRIFLLPASAAQAPHKRERVWIIANRNGKRCDMWCDSWEERFSEENINRHLASIQSEWNKHKPKSWKTFKSADWFSYNSYLMRENDGVPSRMDSCRIKSLGNAIVPQIVFPIMKIICEI